LPDMRLTILGGSGAWPTELEACSGYLLEHDTFRLVIDLGYATLPRLLRHTGAEQVDAVIISHGHPDHCADLNPLLRARALRPAPPPALPVYGLPGSLDAVLALDKPGMLSDAYQVTEFVAGDSLTIGPFVIETRPLRHFVPNVGLRVSDGAAQLAP
jgi:ribonuclease BN (tRNA processing enzyme)